MYTILKIPTEGYTAGNMPSRFTFAAGFRLIWGRIGLTDRGYEMMYRKSKSEEDAWERKVWYSSMQRMHGKGLVPGNEEMYRLSRKSFGSGRK